MDRYVTRIGDVTIQRVVPKDDAIPSLNTSQEDEEEDEEEEAEEEEEEEEEDEEIEKSENIDETPKDIIMSEETPEDIVDQVAEVDDHVLQSLENASGEIASVMDSSELLRNIKEEPMEQEETPEPETSEKEVPENDEESSKRKQDSDDDEIGLKKKKQDEDNETEKKKALNMRRNIREVMDENQLDEATLAAQRQEMERLRRVQDQQRYLRDVQRQMQINRQNHKTQSRVISLLQGNSSMSLLKGKSTGTTVKPSSSVSLVKLGSDAPPQVLNKKVLEAIRAEKSVSPPPMRILNKHMVTPSVTIAPVKSSFPSKKDIPEPDVVTISSSDEDERIDAKVDTAPLSDDDDCIVLSDPSDDEEEADVDPTNSGMHTNDLFNTPDEQGRVLINVGKQEGEPEIFLAPQIARIIKPHQIGGVRFLFDNVVESVERFHNSTGFGCILAHSMGLGKTLQVVSFCDVFLRETTAKTVMCIMPINTLQNWMAEFNLWLPMDGSTTPLSAQGEVRTRHFKIFVLNDFHKTIVARSKVVAEWKRDGGVLLIGYEMYRQLSLKRSGRVRKGKKRPPDEDIEDEKNKPFIEQMHEALVKPGPDLVICDEGHRIKNSHASISHALKQIRTKRRVVLTGYPLQNNLLEYWCMVDFVRPNYLGTKTEFSNMFERPIQNGQCIDSTPQDIRLMRYRAHVLHSLLEGFVQRRSHSVLRHTLPQKEEYVLLIRMTSFQRKLYDTFMNEVVRTKAVPNPLKAFAVCCKIWNHPDILYNFLKKRELDELQDLDIDETAPIVAKGETASPRGKKGEKKGKGKKAAVAVPMKSPVVATVPPTTQAAEVKTEDKYNNFNYYQYNNQQNFNNEQNYQNYQNYNNYNYNNYNNYNENNYSYNEYNNYNNNYYQEQQNFDFNYQNRPIKREPGTAETIKKEDKKEDVHKQTFCRGLSGGEVVYNYQNNFEDKKDFFQTGFDFNQFNNPSSSFNWENNYTDKKKSPEKSSPDKKPDVYQNNFDVYKNQMAHQNQEQNVNFNQIHMSGDMMQNQMQFDVQNQGMGHENVQQSNHTHQNVQIGHQNVQSQNQTHKNVQNQAMGHQNVQPQNQTHQNIQMGHHSNQTIHNSQHQIMGHQNQNMGHVSPHNQIHQNIQQNMPQHNQNMSHQSVQMSQQRHQNPQIISPPQPNQGHQNMHNQMSNVSQPNQGHQNMQNQVLSNTPQQNQGHQNMLNQMISNVPQQSQQNAINQMPNTSHNQGHQNIQNRLMPALQQNQGPQNTPQIMQNRMSNVQIHGHQNMHNQIPNAPQQNQGHQNMHNQMPNAPQQNQGHQNMHNQMPNAPQQNQGHQNMHNQMPNAPQQNQGHQNTQNQIMPVLQQNQQHQTGHNVQQNQNIMGQNQSTQNMMGQNQGTQNMMGQNQSTQNMMGQNQGTQNMMGHSNQQNQMMNVGHMEHDHNLPSSSNAMQINNSQNADYQPYQERQNENFYPQNQYFGQNYQQEFSNFQGQYEYNQFGPGPSGIKAPEIKEKRGMSCQTDPIDKDDKPYDKTETEKRLFEQWDKEEGNKLSKDDPKDKKEEEIVKKPEHKSGKEEPGIPYDWATELLKGYVPGDIEASGKMAVFFCILEESIALGDRILVFSQSLFTLNLMEELLQRQKVFGKEEKWAKNVNYYRLDGSTAAIEREKLINEFNSNPNLHLFLVSTRAGSLGINLVGANRVIVFDASWNPCHDTQAVCRVYRYGQKKPCFVYRLVTDNCLEKKIYDRQINKQGMSDRVVDECNPDAHLSIKEVTSLCWDDKEDETPRDFTNLQDTYIDVVIQKILQKHSSSLSKEPFQHESLLVDRKEKKLSQAEKRLAKRSYELEKQASNSTSRPPYYNNSVGTQGGIIRGNDKPMASVRPMQSELNSQMVRDGPRQRGWIPASVWQRQGMSAQEMTLPLDVVIPTNAPDRSSIVLKAGQKVMVLKSPKGIYMQLENGKIIAIRTSLKANMKDKEQPQPQPPKKQDVRQRVPALRSNVTITPSRPLPSRPQRPVRAVGPVTRPPVSVSVRKNPESGDETPSQEEYRKDAPYFPANLGPDVSISSFRPTSSTFKPPSPQYYERKDDKEYPPQAYPNQEPKQDKGFQPYYYQQTSNYYKPYDYQTPNPFTAAAVASSRNFEPYYQAPYYPPFLPPQYIPPNQSQPPNPPPPPPQ